MSTTTSLAPLAGKLPEFDQEAMDRRFVAEVHRLFEVGVFSTFREFLDAIAAHPSLLSNIESGKNHCNQRMLYNLLRQYPAADVNWVLFGAALTGRAEPVRTLQRQRGRPVEKGVSTRKPA
ncbi:hypothetical protein [Hymenobacter algoricola]|uniref:Transcriptional regulator n=1 Tax=Hymenobacter algoricola TaxID=486267 RepID=A0ABP7N9P3_9BACT